MHPDVIPYVIKIVRDDIVAGKTKSLDSLFTGINFIDFERMTGIQRHRMSLIRRGKANFTMDEKRAWRKAFNLKGYQLNPLLKTWPNK